MIRVLTQEELALRWSEIKPYIDKAIDHGLGETTSMDMFIGAMNGTYECWEIPGKGFGMCRVNHFDQHSQLQVVTYTGEDWDDYGAEGLDFIEAAAKEIGCKYVTIWGRPGWRKKLKPYGYEHTYEVLTKEV